MLCLIEIPSFLIINKNEWIKYLKEVGRYGKVIVVYFGEDK